MGRLKYRLLDRQKPGYEVHHSPDRKGHRTVYRCTRRFGKSDLLLTLCTEYMLRFPKSQGVFVAPVERELKEYMRPLLRSLLDTCPEDFQPIFNEVKNCLTFHNGSILYFSGCNKQHYSVFRGWKLKVIAVDEMASIDDLENAIDDVFYPATWDSKGEMLLAGTPPPIPSPDHPVNHYITRAKMNNAYFFCDIDQAGFTKEEIAAAEAEYEGGRQHPKFQREFLCLDVKDPESVIIPEFDEKLHVSIFKRPDYFAYLNKVEGMDIGVTDKLVNLFGYYDFPTGILYIEDEIVLSGGSSRTDLLAEQINFKEQSLGWDKTPKATITRWSDNSNLILLNDLNQIHHIPVLASEKTNKAQAINTVRIMFKQGRIKISPKAKLLIATLGAGFWDKNHTDFGRSKELGHMDAIDALVYLVRNINMSHNPIPITYGINPQNTVGYGREGQIDKSPLVLKQLFSKDRYRYDKDLKPPKKVFGGLL